MTATSPLPPDLAVPNHEPVSDDERTDWRIDSMPEGEWAARKYAQAVTAADEVEAQRVEWVAQIEAWAEAEKTRHERDASYFEGRLAEWAIRRRHEEDVLTTHVPSATIRTRRRAARVEVLDDDAVIAAFTGTPLLDEIAPAGPRRVRVTALRERVTLLDDGSADLTVMVDVTGEKLAGVYIAPEEISASVEVR